MVSYDRVVAQGAVAGVGRLDELRADPTEGTAVLAGLLTDASQQERLRELGGRLVDGRGRERVADAMARHVR